MQNEVWVCNGQEFKVGDKVRVMRQVESFDPDGMGEGIRWANEWIPAEDLDWKAMDGYLGLEFVIESIDSHGAVFETFEADGPSYAFPLKALDKVA